MASAKDTARALVAAKMRPMALTKKEIKKQEAPTPVSSPSRGERYPWGLTLHLDELAMQKLALSKELKAGMTVTLVGKAKVTECMERESEGGETCTCTLQITALALVPARMARTVKDTD